MKYVEIKITALLVLSCIHCNFNLCVAGWANFCVGLVP